jgi:hypothetical protein
LQQIEQTEAPQSAHSATAALPQSLSSTAETYSMVQNNVIPDLDSGIRNAGCHGLAVEKDKDQNTAFVVARIFDGNSKARCNSGSISSLRRTITYAPLSRGGSRGIRD